MFIPCNAQDYPATAELLLALAKEAGHNIWAVETVTGGFEVPADVAAQLLGGPAEMTPPPSWDEPLPKSEIELVDGKYMLTKEAVESRLALHEMLAEDLDSTASEVIDDALPAMASREVIRAWAKDNGYAPAPQGKLKASVVEAFRVANPEMATSE